MEIGYEREDECDREESLEAEEDRAPIQGILYPGRMTYPGRGGTQATAEIRKVEFKTS